MKKMKTLISSLTVFLMTAFVPAVSAASVDTGKIENSLDSLYNSLAALGITAAVVAAAIGAFALFGPRNAKEWAKSHIFYVAAGVFILLLAPTLVTWIASVVN